jgi:putative peptidoglycan lipid II flippase
MYALQVLAASALLAVFLMWGSSAFQWTQLRAQGLMRIGLLVLFLAGSAVIYFGALWAAGLKLRQLVRR